MNCPVDVPIGTSPAVYQQKQIPFTSEEIIKRAENLFDSGEFSYVKPLDCYTLDELNEEYKSLEKLKEKKDEEDKVYYWLRSSDVEYYKEYFNEAKVKDFKEGDFSEGIEAASYDKVMIMEGKIGGEVYHLLAFTSGGHNYLTLCRRSQGYELASMFHYFSYPLKTYDYIDGESIEDIYKRTKAEALGYDVESTNSGDDKEEEAFISRALVNEEKEATQSIKNEYGENICSYSEEEAGKLALQYAALLGDTDMTIVRTNWYFGSDQLSYMIEHPDEDVYTFDKANPNGYVFYLQRQYGNLPCNESNFWWREATDTDKETAANADPSGIVAEQENYRVEVTDEGVVSIDTIEPWYEIAKTLSDSTSLMDFNDIQELARGYFEELVKDSEADISEGKNIARMSEVSLRYATVLYDGEYTLIPCWFFNQSDGNDAGQATVMVINVIDGSKVFSRRMDFKLATN